MLLWRCTMQHACSKVRPKRFPSNNCHECRRLLHSWVVKSVYWTVTSVMRLSILISSISSSSIRQLEIVSSDNQEPSWNTPTEYSTVPTIALAVTSIATNSLHFMIFSQTSCLAYRLVAKCMPKKVWVVGVADCKEFWSCPKTSAEFPWCSGAISCATVRPRFWVAATGTFQRRPWEVLTLLGLEGIPIQLPSQKRPAVYVSLRLFFFLCCNMLLTIGNQMMK
jgi:hypothetical protein